MHTNPERVARIREALRGSDMDALVCTLPANVLMLTGYWPVVGNAIAVATPQATVILAPEDEREIASDNFCAEMVLFKAGSLEAVYGAAAAVSRPLSDIMARLGLEGKCIGIEANASSVPAPYVGMQVFRDDINRLVRDSGGTLVDASGLITGLRKTKTPVELDSIKVACHVAQKAYEHGTAELHVGVSEAKAATAYRGILSTYGIEQPGVQRADGSVYCMSGPNAAEAYAAFQRSRSRKLHRGDFVLVHCNSYVDGFWTDITRTYCMGQPTQEQRKRLDAMLRARDAGIDAVRPGICACEVDDAVRNVLTDAGYGPEFKHPTGHGVGFEAIDHNAPPRLHPKSQDTIEAGMVFNIEPGMYFDNESGMRHCDMVVATEDGCELLTPFHGTVEDLVLAV